MALYLGILIFSFIATSLVIVPFINLLYSLKFQRLQQISKDVFGKSTSIFNKFHKKKVGVPIGGGLLIIMVVSLLFTLLLPLSARFGVDVTSLYKPISVEVNIIFLTFLSFGILGLYDDIHKFFSLKRKGFFGLSMKHKLFMQILIATVIACMLYFQLGIDFVNIPFFRTIQLGYFYIPFAVFVIIAFTNAINITDGLDGLCSGSLMISLFGLWFLSASILDVPLLIFIALWLGSLISFLYFNVFPARIMLGDVGALSFGATLAVVGLLLGKVAALLIIGFIFILDGGSSFLQLMSKRFRGKKIFPAAPIHLSLQEYGWAEPKIVQRAWLVQIMLTIFGLWLTML